MENSEITSQCCQVIFSSMENISDDQFWMLLDIAEDQPKTLDFEKQNLPLVVSILAQYVFLAIKKGDTKLGWEIRIFHKENSTRAHLARLSFASNFLL
jgi:hypothetical protein